MNQYAVNPATGEVAEFDGSAWKPVEKSRTAVSQDGEIAVYDGKAWSRVGRAGPVKRAAQTPEEQQAEYLNQDTLAPRMTLDGQRTLEAPVDNLATKVRGVGQTVADTALLGGADELVAGVKGTFSGDPWGTFEDTLRQLETERGQFAAENPNLETGAEVAGLVGSPLNLLGGEFIAGARGVGGQMLRGGVTGAGMGAASGGLTTQGDLDTRLEAAGYGAAGGAAAGTAFPLVGAAIAPRVNPQVRLLMDRGVTPTPGQIMGGIPNQIEEKLGSVIPGLGDLITTSRQRANDQFNRAVYNEVLQPMGLQVAPDVPIGREGIRTVHQAISDQYNQTLRNVTFAVDPQLNADIQAVGRRSQQLARDQRERYDEIFTGKIQDVLQSHGGTLTGPQLQGLLAELRRDVRGYSSSGSHNERQLGERLGEIVDAINDSLVRTNPAQAQPLTAANAAFARLVRLERAAGGTGNDNGVFTPKQLQGAVKAEDSSARKNQFAQGDALMQELSDAGRAVLADKFPNSGTPGRVASALALGGGIGYIEPTMLAALAAGSLPYTGPGGRLTAGLMTRRGPAAAAIRGLGLRAIAPAANASGLLAAPPTAVPRVAR
jgi:hypothetical protein